MTSTRTFLLLLGMFSIYLQISETSKILFLLPIASKSHKNVFDSLIHELANRNHEITVVSPFKLTPEKKNVRDVVMQGELLHDPKFLKEIFSYIGAPPIFMFFGFKEMMTPICENYLTNPEMNTIFKAGKTFDIVIVSAFMNECPLMTASLLGKHVMLLSPATVIPWGRSYVPTPLSFIPTLVLPYTDRMSFFQRLNNVVTTVGLKLMYKYYLIPALQHAVCEHIPEAPALTEAESKVTMVLTNVDPVMISSRPTMPNIVDVGGMHCRDANPLPKEFEDFIQSSGEHGFIVFGLGSNAQSKFLPPEKKEAFINAFSRLKQKVIWKYEENLDNLPANVKITPWMPQQDLLGHPKCRLFISHGGLLSMQETVYHGVPVIGIPLFADQPANIETTRQLKFGDGISFNNITADGVYEMVQRILKDKSYTDNVKKYSAIMRHRPQRPEQVAAFWVEYVILHNGAPHLRSTAFEELNFFQYFLLDVLAFILIVVLTVIYISVKVTKLFLHKVLPGKKLLEKKNKKVE